MSHPSVQCHRKCAASGDRRRAPLRSRGKIRSEQHLYGQDSNGHACHETPESPDEAAFEAGFVGDRVQIPKIHCTCAFQSRSGNHLRAGPGHPWSSSHRSNTHYRCQTLHFMHRDVCDCLTVQWRGHDGGSCQRRCIRSWGEIISNRAVFTWRKDVRIYLINIIPCL